MILGIDDDRRVGRGRGERGREDRKREGRKSGGGWLREVEEEEWKKSEIRI